MDQRKRLLATPGSTRSFHLLLHRFFPHWIHHVYTTTIRLSSRSLPLVPGQINRRLQTRGHSGELRTKIAAVHDGRVCLYRKISQPGVILHLQLSTTTANAKIVWRRPPRPQPSLSSLCHSVPAQISSQLTTTTHEPWIIYHISSQTSEWRAPRHHHFQSEESIRVSKISGIQQNPNSQRYANRWAYLHGIVIVAHCQRLWNILAFEHKVGIRRRQKQHPPFLNRSLSAVFGTFEFWSGILGRRCHLHSRTRIHRARYTQAEAGERVRDDESCE